MARRTGERHEISRKFCSYSLLLCPRVTLNSPPTLYTLGYVVCVLITAKYQMARARLSDSAATVLRGRMVCCSPSSCSCHQTECLKMDTSSSLRKKNVTVEKQSEKFRETTDPRGRQHLTGRTTHTLSFTPSAPHHHCTTICVHKVQATKSASPPHPPHNAESPAQLQNARSAALSQKYLLTVLAVLAS